MSDTFTKLPSRFAALGVFVGLIVMAAYWYSYSHDTAAAQSLGNSLDRTMFIVCPGLLLQFFTIGTSDKLGWAMWGVAVLLNGPIYFVLGLIVSTFLKRKQTT